MFNSFIFSESISALDKIYHLNILIIIFIACRILLAFCVHWWLYSFSLDFISKCLPYFLFRTALIRWPFWFSFEVSLCPMWFWKTLRLMLLFPEGAYFFHCLIIFSAPIFYCLSSSFLYRIYFPFPQTFIEPF